MANPHNKPLPQGPSAKVWASDLERARQPGPHMSFHQGEAHDHLTATGMSTRAVHAGQYEDPVTKAVGTPIFQSSTFLLTDDVYDSIKEGRAREHFIYARYGNPSQWSVQEKLASLEGAESAVVFSSGMAAISSAVMAMMDKGAHLITSRDIYGGTYNFFHEDLTDFGMSVSFVDLTDIDAIEAAITDKTKVLFFEALTNPLLKIAPIKEIVALAKKYNLRTIIDSTFATPANLRPLEMGVDIVIQSASKYLNGHSDLIGGAAMGSRKCMDQVWVQMLKFGGSLDPHACYLLERGLKTFGIRMRVHNENAFEFAKWLETREEVRCVYYPGLASHPQHQLAKELMDNYSGMVSFELNGTDEDSDALLAALKLPKVATSLGGVESLISLPHNTSQATLMKSQLATIGINPGLVRISLGIEDIDDIKTDFIQAFNTIKQQGYLSC